MPRRPDPRTWSPTRTGFTTQERRRILNRQPVCAVAGCGARSTIADHIIGLADGRARGLPESMLHSWQQNGQGMCGPHHDEKTKQEISRGRQRKSRYRPAERHPGLL